MTLSARQLRCFFAIGRLFSPLYGTAMRLRAWLYRRGIRRREKMAVPVVSVGNLTMGGTGKTPLVLYLVRRLRELGYKPAILSRGYGRRRSRLGAGATALGQPLVVADGQKVLLEPAVAGDEPVLLARSLPGVPVLVGARRVESGRYGVEQLGADCLVLDDGFQHQALCRDLDLALFSARDLPFQARVFPGGPLREPWSALGRADGVVITGVNEENREAVAAFRRLLATDFPSLPSFVGEYLPVGLVVGATGASLALAKGRGKPLYAFAGIAQPESFRQTLQRQDFLLTAFKAFADHYSYGEADYRQLVAAARQRGAAALITTEKDLVKLRPWLDDFPLLALRVELLMEDDFDRFVRRRLAELKPDQAG